MKNFTYLALTLVILLAWGHDIKAIPAFARKYNMSCTTCHSPVPRLKAYAETFAGNGFRLEDKESPRFFTETGDELLSLIRDFPISARIESHIKFNNDNSRTNDLGTPYLLKLMSGGELSKKFSYYFYFYIDELGEVVGMEDAYLMYNDLAGTPVDIAIGQFSASDPLFKPELKLSLEGYAIYKVHPAYSSARLSYDRGVLVTAGFETGTDMAFEVINGNGLTDANEAKVFDNDNYKNFAFRVSQSFGEIFRIGGFAYYGNEIIGIDGAVDFKNTIYYIGPDITLSIGDKAELNVQYLVRTDSKMLQGELSPEPDTDVSTSGGFAELIITPKGDQSRWYMSLLGNYIDSDYNELDYKSGTFHLGYLARRNIRLVSEFTYDFTDEDKTYGKGSLGIIAVF